MVVEIPLLKQTTREVIQASKQIILTEVTPLVKAVQLSEQTAIKETIRIPLQNQILIAEVITQEVIDRAVEVNHQEVQIIEL